MEEKKKDEYLEENKAELRKTVAERLTTIAAFKEIDAKEFAKRCEISERRVKNLMNGTASLKIPELAKISEVFDVSVDYIMGFYPYPLPRPKDEVEAAMYEMIGKMDIKELEEFSNKLREEAEKRKS